MFLESQGLVCSGPLRNGEHSHALLSERAPNSRVLPREVAPAELARRFFTGHGPAGRARPTVHLMPNFD